MPSDIAVELINVTKRFKGTRESDRPAVDNVNLSIKNGEFFSLLGSSGCGKSTTLRMIAGFETPNPGEVRIMGQSVGDTPPHLRPVNMVFQNYALFPHMDVFANVAFGLRMDGVPKSEIAPRVEAALELVQLGGKGKRRPKQLSGGQQQRVSLARALVKRPALLLLDEPLGALDRKLRKAMQLELKHMQQKLGITFVYVTHDQEEALTMSDRIAVMDKGKILQVGTPVEIYEEPASWFVADFIGESNFIRATVKEAGGGLAVVSAPGGPDLRLPCDDPAVTGGREVTLMVRPEKGTVSRQPSPEEGMYSLPGRVQEIIYLGNDITYNVVFPDRQQMAIRLQNTDRADLANFHRDEEVYVHLAAGHIHLLKEALADIQVDVSK